MLLLLLLGYGAITIGVLFLLLLFLLLKPRLVLLVQTDETSLMLTGCRCRDVVVAASIAVDVQRGCNRRCVIIAAVGKMRNSGGGRHGDRTGNAQDGH